MLYGDRKLDVSSATIDRNGEYAVQFTDGTVPTRLNMTCTNHDATPQSGTFLVSEGYAHTYDIVMSAGNPLVHAGEQTPLYAQLFDSSTEISLAGVPIHFDVLYGEGTLGESSAVTDENGICAVTYIQGSTWYEHTWIEARDEHDLGATGLYMFGLDGVDDGGDDGGQDGGDGGGGDDGGGGGGGGGGGSGGEDNPCGCNAVGCNCTAENLCSSTENPNMGCPVCRCGGAACECTSINDASTYCQGQPSNRNCGLENTNCECGGSGCILVNCDCGGDHPENCQGVTTYAWVAKNHTEVCPSPIDAGWKIEITWEQYEATDASGAVTVLKYRKLRLEWTPGTIAVNDGHGTITCGGVTLDERTWFGTPATPDTPATPPTLTLPDGVKMIPRFGISATPPAVPKVLWWEEFDSTGRALEAPSFDLDFYENTLRAGASEVVQWRVKFGKP